MKQLDMTIVGNHDGYLNFIASEGGQVFEKTGLTLDNRPVYCKLGDFELACKSFTDELLYVLTIDRRIIPRDQYNDANAKL